jgi:hypothetical protein
MPSLLSGGTDLKAGERIVNIQDGQCTRIGQVALAIPRSQVKPVGTLLESCAPAADAPRLCESRHRRAI